MILKEKERSVIEDLQTREKLCGKVWKIRRTGQRPGA